MRRTWPPTGVGSLYSPVEEIVQLGKEVAKKEGKRTLQLCYCINCNMKIPHNVKERETERETQKRGERNFGLL